MQIIIKSKDKVFMNAKLSEKEVKGNMNLIHRRQIKLLRNKKIKKASITFKDKKTSTSIDSLTYYFTDADRKAIKSINITVW